jgi:hypothetical protein
MPANMSPIFVLSPKCGHGQVSTANTNRDGTGTLATLFTAGSEGALLSTIFAKAAVTTTAGMVRIYISTDGGTTKRLIAEIPISAVTVGANTPGAEGVWTPPVPLMLPASAVVYASTHNAESINVVAIYGDF